MAVLAENGKLLFSQKNGQFEAMRRLQSTAVTEFLVQWKPTRCRLLRGGGQLLR